MAENIRNSAKTIGTTPLIISPTLEMGKRNVLVITNTSTGGQVISISFGEQATALQGIVLYPGGSWFEVIGAGFNPTSEIVWGVSSAASGIIAIQERIERGI